MKLFKPPEASNYDRWHARGPTPYFEYIFADTW